MYLRKIIVVTDVAVLTIDAIKIVFKPVFLKQVRLLKPLDNFMTLLKYARKHRDAKEDVDKVCIEVQKTSDNTGGKPTRCFSLQRKTFSALNYAKDFGSTMKESLKRTTNSKGCTQEKSNCPLSNTFMPLLALSTMSLPSVQTVPKEVEVVMRDWIENFRPV